MGWEVRTGLTISWRQQRLSLSFELGFSPFNQRFLMEVIDTIHMNSYLEHFIFSIVDPILKSRTEKSKSKESPVPRIG